ncbi:protein-glutamate methylesterase/protein-glutamine glutaminase [Pseudomonas turukhanskensis]|uniref:Protein-glutamate methylesterase/protein-glutamine glutaminase n=1 Tax=Pseudomonas turukhanskensis TaxID=1806536 RepID=A0A9W6K6K2_9PSED|nr:chemotaxis response regulator protein-glutamate methylesterase [Pseudomonas turukhanskensis]GLK89827.1 chemotaxis response regulator protein-glutamate methylesterase [Pseudomonas turukhanskensis]
MPHNARIKVFIVDDSALVRQVLTACLHSHPTIDVIGQAADPLFALEKMRKQWPDVLVLDVEMPRMDGITFLRKIMAERPTPSIICSTLTEAGAAITLEALAAGAVGVFTKAKLGLKDSLQQISGELIRQIEIAARSQPHAMPRTAAPVVPSSTAPKVAAPDTAEKPTLTTTDRVVALGTSTGGTQALEVVLRQLPAGCPGIVIVQHMPEKFTAAFAQRLDSICAIDVREAKHMDRVRPGLALVAPGGKHMQLKRSGAQYFVEVIDGPPVNRHKPSVDVLFRSVAKHAGHNALGVIMTGMGDDGARGLLTMREAGARTIAQDEASCVVFGMPKEALRLEAAQSTEALGNLPKVIIQYGRAP